MTQLNSHKSISFLRYMIEHDLNLLTEWFKSNQLSLNLDKTVLMKFWLDKHDFIVKIGDITLQSVKVTKFRGIHGWSHHVNVVYNKILANKHLLQTARNLLDSECLKHVYNAHIHSHINYGLAIWGNMILKTDLAKLHTL